MNSVRTLEEKPTEKHDAVEPDYGEIIDTCVKELRQISLFQGNISNHNVCRLLSQAGEAYAKGRGQGSEAFENVKRAYEELWPASLQANYALAIHSLTELDNIEISDTTTMAFNNHLSAAVSANAKLWAGDLCNVISYNTEDIRERIQAHMLAVLEKYPNHRFSQNIHVPSFI